MKTRRLALLLLALLTLRAPGIPSEPVAAQEAETELFAARYDRAAQLYSKLLRDDPAWAPGYYGIVRALIGAHRAPEAYAAAAEGLQHAAESAEVYAAAGLAAYRRGDLPKAEAYFRKARQIDPNYAYALSGLASIYNSVSRFRTGQTLMAQAYRASPADPLLIAAYAGQLRRGEHIAALERALSIYDPVTREARRLSAHIAVDKAAGDRKLEQLGSPYQVYDIELVQIGIAPRHSYGVGLRVRLNDKRPVLLILDTGASGISISTKAAEKAGLERLGGKSFEVGGIGDYKPQDAFTYLANAVAVGDLRFSNFLVEGFKTAKTDDYDGFIGTDVFHRFQVYIDFQKLLLTLVPNPNGQPLDDEPADASDTVPAGFSRAFRFWHALAVQTSVNQGPQHLFVVDSGAWGNLIDTGLAQGYTKVRRDHGSGLGGLQGPVDEVSRASRVSLVFAGFRQDNSDVLAASLEAMGDGLGVGIAGILGMPVLWQMKLTIDYRNGALRFEKAGVR